MKSSLIILFSLILLQGSALGQVDSEFKEADHYKTRKFNVAIFPSTYEEYIGSNLRFSPTRIQVDSAEKELREGLKLINKDKINQSNSPVIHENLKSYKRQYLGYIDQNGNRILYINCFWESKHEKFENWLMTFIQVSDGGSYYWSIKYNLDTRQLFDLQVNGHA